MNTKIQNYVDVLFKGIPNTKKAQELREEILSTLSDHFEAHIAEGKSENQAYTDSLSDLGDIDELLKDLEPEQNLKDKIDEYRKIRARNTSISVACYILGVIFLIGLGGAAAIFEIGDVEKFGLIGLLCMFVCIAIGTSILIYTRMSRPQDVDQYLSRGNEEVVPKKTGGKMRRIIDGIYWPIVLVVYLLVSFGTGKWGITWIIWLISVAIKKAIEAFFSDDGKN